MGFSVCSNDLVGYCASSANVRTVVLAISVFVHADILKSTMDASACWYGGVAVAVTCWFLDLLDVNLFGFSFVVESVSSPASVGETSTSAG